MNGENIREVGKKTFINNKKRVQEYNNYRIKVVCYIWGECSIFIFIVLQNIFLRARLV